MWDVGTSDFYIWKLDRTTETWSRTNTRLNDRSSTRVDVLWDGTKSVRRLAYVQRRRRLRVVAPVPIQLRRGDGRVHARQRIPGHDQRGQSETLVIDKDSTGKLWATWSRAARSGSTAPQRAISAWGTPFALSAAGTVDGDDISSLIAFGGNKIGLMWSDQDASADRFAIHTDGQTDTTWSAAETALSGSGLADDHLNLKTDASGRVFAVVKTSTNPQIIFLARDHEWGMDQPSGRDPDAGPYATDPHR